jgi:hypothetical protein
MATLLTMRDGIKNFCSRYDKVITPIIKFVLAFVMFLSFTYLTGYNDTVSSGLIMFLLSVVCAFVSEGITLFLGGVVLIMNYMSASKEIGITFILVFVVMYCIYIRFFPKTAWLILYAPLFFMLKLQYLLPLLAGMLVGPAGVISMAFGCVFYYFGINTAGYLEEMAAATNAEEMLESYKYLFQNLVEDKNLILTIVVFAVISIITYVIYRMSVEYAWYAAIIVGGLFEIILFLVGNVLLDANVSISGILGGTIVAVIIAVIVQFFKVVVDYSRTENTQFEDDEYYYYVKAVPKVVMGKQQKNVRTISTSTQDTADSKEGSVSGVTR